MKTGSSRPVTGCIALDPAYSGGSGVVVGRYGAPRSELRRLGVRDMNTASRVFLAELGQACVDTIPAGERFVLVAERDAFGPSVARKLGIAVGIVQGFLVGINAIEPGHRHDVTSTQWRTVYGAGERRRIMALAKSRRRAAWKALAAREAACDDADVAEACMMWFWAEARQLGVGA